jgi:hypothetical protein
VKRVVVGIAEEATQAAGNAATAVTDFVQEKF